MILKNGKRLDGCSDTVPIGTVNPYLGTVAPFGYLLLQGQYVSKSLYPELYAICGSTFGPETDTEFKLPDLRGQTIAGYKEGDSTFGTLGGLMGALTKSYTPAGTNTGAAVTAHTYTPAGTNKNMAVTMNAISLSHTGGAVKSHTLTTSEIPSHSHKVNVCASDIAAAGNGIGRELLGTSTRTQWDTTSTGGGGGHSHDFTQPSAHSFTPTAKSYTNPTFTGTQATLSHTVTQPTFTGTQANINVVQPTIILNWVVKAIMLIPNQSTVVNATNESTTNVYSTTFINNLVQQVKQETLNSAFPIGKVEVFYDDADHSNYLGFTWVRELEGLSPVGYKASDSDYSTIGSTLGSKTHSTTYTPAGTNTGTAVTLNAIELTHSGGAVQSHTLTAAESGLPAHTHQLWLGYIVDQAIQTSSGQSIVMDTHSWSYNSTDSNSAKNASSGHSHGFTQPSKHSFTPTTKTVTQPTFTGTQATISMDTRDPQKVVAYWRRVS